MSSRLVPLCGCYLERVVVLLELDTITVEETLSAQKYGDIGIDEHGRCSESFSLRVNVKTELTHKPVCSLHGNPDGAPCRALISIDSEHVRNGGGHDDLVGAGVDEGEEFPDLISSCKFNLYDGSLGIAAVNIGLSGDDRVFVFHCF